MIVISDSSDSDSPDAPLSPFVTLRKHQQRFDATPSKPTIAAKTPRKMKVIESSSESEGEEDEVDALVDRIEAIDIKEINIRRSETSDIKEHFFVDECNV